MCIRDRLSVVGGKLSAVLFDQQAGGFLQIARAAVIAKTFPQLEQPVFGTGCKRLDGGQLGKKALEVGPVSYTHLDVYKRQTER